MRSRWIALAVFSLAACSFDSTGGTDVDAAADDIDARPGRIDATAGTPDAAANTPDATAVSPDAAPGDPDAPPPPPDATPTDATGPVVTDRGLLVRYYIDEAASGQAPTELADSAPSPLPLALSYTPEMMFTDVGGNRGLQWTQTGRDARASVTVDGTKLDTDLEGSTTATIEVVIDIDAVTGSVSRISHIGIDMNSGKLSLVSQNAGVLRLVWRETTAGEWSVDLPASGRIAVHAVIDTTQAVADDRVALYVDGVPMARTGGTPPPRDQTVDLGIGHHYVLGNREVGGRSFQGRMFYAAMYNSALTPAEVANNASVLLADDDTP